MGGIRRIKSTMYRHLGGGGKGGLAELREQRAAGREMRDEDAAERSLDTPPRRRPSWRQMGWPVKPGTRRADGKVFLPFSDAEHRPVKDASHGVMARHPAADSRAVLDRWEQRLAAWIAGAPDREIKRLNNVYKLRDIRKGIHSEPAETAKQEEVA